MKVRNFLKSFQQWISMWMWFIFIIVLWWAVYAAWDYSTTVNTSEPLTAEMWNSVKDKVVSNDSSITTNAAAIVPSGAVMSFNLASCPTGWSEADGTSWTPDLRWTFIRWMNGDANGRDVSRVLANYQADDFKSHNHRLHSLTTQSIQTTSGAWGIYAPMIGPAATIDNWPTTQSTGWTETRPKNIVLLYCVKD